jgi:hypothetical protein
MRDDVKKKRRFFKGNRTETAPVSEYTAHDGSKYIVRKNDSKYPKHTSIPVSPSILKIYSFLRRNGKYNNYDELLVHMVEKMLECDNLKGSSQLDEEDIEKLISRARIDLRFREKARNKAEAKQRYRPR